MKPLHTHAKWWAGDSFLRSLRGKLRWCLGYISSTLKSGVESTMSECAGACCGHEGTNAICRPVCGQATPLACTRFVSNIRWPELGSTIDTGTGTLTYCCGGTCNGGCMVALPTTTCLVGLGMAWYEGGHRMLETNWCWNVSVRACGYWRATFLPP